MLDWLLTDGQAGITGVMPPTPLVRLAALLLISLASPALAQTAPVRGPAETGAFQAGLRHGPWTFYHRNGQKSAQGSFLQGRRHGAWTFFYEDGQIKQKVAYKDGYEDGTLVAYFPNGQKAVEGGFLDGRRHGAWKEWYEDGRPRLVARYVKGMREGAWTMYRQAEIVSPAPTIPPPSLRPASRVSPRATGAR